MAREQSDPPVLSGRSGRITPQDRMYRSLLLDFYGGLLSRRQKECCELFYNEDLSLSEIAEACEISRQGVWDHIRRGTDALEEIEQQTGLLQRFTAITDRLKQLDATLLRLEERSRGMSELNSLARSAAEEVRSLLKAEE